MIAYTCEKCDRHTVKPIEIEKSYGWTVSEDMTYSGNPLYVLCPEHSKEDSFDEKE